MPEYTSFPGVDFRDCSRRRNQCWYVIRPESHVQDDLVDICILTATNYRLKPDDISYIFTHAEAEVLIVDAEFLPLLDGYRKLNPNVPFIVDTDTDASEGQLSGPFDEAILEGLKYDNEQGDKGWAGLETQVEDEEGIIALAYTSGTTAKPKGVEYTHRGCYMAAMGNVIESGLNYHTGRCRYLWTLPMFHAMGWTFPWAVTAVRGTHYCLRKIDYPEIWRLLKEEHLTHYNAAPTVSTLLCNAKEAERLPQPVRVTVAASPPSAHLFEQMTNLNLHPVHVFGLTETYGPITKGYLMPAWEDLPKAEKYQKMARQGHGLVTSLPIRVIKTDLPEGTIIDVEKDGKEIGEIVCIGNICAKGYLNDPEATRKLFAGGVLHTGDLAVWHPDGAAQILDRAKDIIISGRSTCFALPIHQSLMLGQLRWREHLFGSSGVHAGYAPRHSRSRSGRNSRLALGGTTEGFHHGTVWEAAQGRGCHRLGEAQERHQQVYGTEGSRDC